METIQFYFFFAFLTNQRKVKENFSSTQKKNTEKGSNLMLLIEHAEVEKIFVVDFFLYSIHQKNVSLRLFSHSHSS
jgi:hypothetical protein